MSNKVLKYTIGISVGVHLLILGIIGGTSASKPIDLDSLKLVKVDLVKTPNEVAVSKPNQPKPEPKPDEAEPAPYVPPVKQMQTAKAPTRKAVEKIVQQVKAAKVAAAARANNTGQRPGNPGGSINLGSTSANGQNLGGSGTSGTGVVPNNNGGQGTGSGTGPGVGTTEPTPGTDGPGTHTVVAPPAPPAPPQPRMVDVTVCAISHMKPGKYCEKRVTESFREGGEPTEICNVCKEPEPVHVNRLADRAEPELIRDCRDKIQIPSSIMDEGIDATVTIAYTCEADGSVSDVKVTRSSGNRDLDRAVVEAAKREMKYKPAVQDGVPRAVKMTRSFKFKV
jgi:TonB family protein